MLLKPYSSIRQGTFEISEIVMIFQNWVTELHVNKPEVRLNQT